MRHTTLLGLLLLLASAPAQAPADPIELLATVTYEHAREMSGIARSATYPDTYWVHNDSGDTPRIFALDAKGEIVFPAWKKNQFGGENPPWPGIELVVAANIDWEDISIADGVLYIAEMGNNGNARRDLGVYVVHEPNPRASERVRPLKFLPIRYPDQEVFPAKKWHFDCEGIFVSEGKLYFVTKHRVAGQINRGQLGAKLYRLDTAHTDRQNVLTLVGEHPAIGMATAAELSPDGTKLAVLSYFALWVFDKPEEGDNWFAGKARAIPLSMGKTKQVEAVCWDDDETLRFTNEQRQIYRVKLAALEPVK